MRFAPESPAHGIPTPDPADSQVALVVDVDGCLVRSDLLWEGVLQLTSRNPRRLAGMARALVGGKAALKAYVAEHGRPHLESLPLDQAVVELIADARAQGREVLLASGADHSQLAEIGRLVQVARIHGSNGTANLTGRNKLSRIREITGTFDYVGNAAADLPLWREARRAYAVNTSPLTLWRARRARPDIEVLASRKGSWRAALRAMRPHQWSKNALLLLPVMAAHLAFGWQLVGQLVAGLLAFSLVASSIYVLNDLIDLPFDRQHPRKRSRPIAAGELGIPAAILLLEACGLVGLALAWTLGTGFLITLLSYAALTFLYSLLLKREAIIDVIALATLYTMRVIGGAVLVDVPLSPWFLAFSVLFFLSLALVKRVVELKFVIRGGDQNIVPGRGYTAGDAAMLLPLGISAEVGSTLVYCLYITSNDVMRLYGRPELLWLGLPILLYWHTRVWLLTSRGEMQEDPVVFALRDRTSRFVFAIFLLVVLLASH